jgi:predicted Zn-dependent peptidase
MTSRSRKPAPASAAPVADPASAAPVADPVAPATPASTVGATLGGEELHTRQLKGGLEAWVWRRRGLQNLHAAFAARFGAMDARFATRDPGPDARSATGGGAHPDRSGPVFEVPDGTAHFLEHMAFDTEKGSALSAFSRLGVRVNAFTSHTATVYLFSGTDNFWPALEALVRLVCACHITPKGVEDERRIIAQEIRMYEDSPDAKAAENLLQALYALHPVRRSIAGTTESVMAITAETLLRCHQTFYHPSNLVFLAAGDFDPEQVFDTVDGLIEELGSKDETVGDHRRPAPAFQRLLPDEPSRPGRAEIVVARPVTRSSFLVGFKDPFPAAGRPLRRDAAFGLLVETLFGPTSPLYSDLYRDGLVDDSFSARHAAAESFGYAVAGGTTRDPAAAAARLLEGISAWRPKGITKPDLERKRRKALGQFAGLADSLEGMATLFLIYRLKGVDLRCYPAVLKAITLDEVNQVFAEVFAVGQASVSIIRPEPG